MTIAGGWVERAALAALLVAIVSAAFNAAAPLVRVSPGVLIHIRDLVAVATGLWLASHLLTRRRPVVPAGIALPAALWLGAMVAAALLAEVRQPFVPAVLPPLAGLLLSWTVFDLASSPSRIARIVAAVAVCGGLLAAIGLLQATGIVDALGLAPLAEMRTIRVGDFARLVSTLEHPNSAAMALGLSVPLSLGATLSARQWPARALFGLCLLLGLAGLVLTLSRGALAAMVVALAVTAATAVWRSQRRLLVGAAVSAASLVVLVALAMLLSQVAALRLSGVPEERWHAAQYALPATLNARAGDELTVGVRLTNAGVRTWESAGPAPVLLSYHLLDAQGNQVTYDGVRTPLQADVAPGASQEVRARVVAPARPGEYRVQWDLLQEGPAWLSWHGAQVAESRLLVEGPAAAPAADAETGGTPWPSERNLSPVGPNRPSIWRVALRMVADRPLLGVGPDGFRPHFNLYAQGEARALHAHNLYLHILVESGMLGLLGFGWASWRLAVGLIRASASGVRLDLWPLVLLGSLTTWYAYGLVEYGLHSETASILFWTVIGLAAAVALRPLPRAETRVLERHADRV